MSARWSSRFESGSTSLGLSVNPVDRGGGSVLVGSMLIPLNLARLSSSFEGGGGLKFESVATSILPPVLREALCCGAVWKTGLVGGWAVGL
jgi:hypothetical protein